MSILISNDKLALAAVDVSTGDFSAIELKVNNWQQQLATFITQLNPSECIVSPEFSTNHQFISILHSQSSPNIISYHNWPKNSQQASEKLMKQFDVISVEGFGLTDKPEACISAAVLLTYLEETQLQPISHLKKIRLLNSLDEVILDRSTIINLELFSGLRTGNSKGSFLDFFDHTRTAMGGRLLKKWIIHPLATVNNIYKRQDAVQILVTKPLIRQSIQECLQKVYDLERIIAKLSLNNGSPKDLVRLAQALKHILELKSLLAQFPSRLFKKILITWPDSILKISDLIENTLVENPPLDPKQGGLVKLGVNENLDEFLKTIETSSQWIQSLEISERKRTGISTLKVKFNKIFGFYIEVSRNQSINVPKNYQRKQTLINAERFITPELKKHEEVVLMAQEKRNALEFSIYKQLVAQILEYTLVIQSSAQAVATLDCISSFAEVSATWNYVKPKLNQEGIIEIYEGRHPVVEATLTDSSFVPNDTILNHQDYQLLLLTGPNMAGKSVYMRQTALIVLMTHLGCFVPASAANISVVDHIFVRSGASDGISSGLSTFMVEMTEAAFILHQATNKSLVILDEIGRGTSTYDGISIAWAIAEYLVKNPKSQALTLFATHYHELQELEVTFPEKIKNFQMVVQQKNNSPIFIHKIERGASPHSFGVAVAKLAGLPLEVTEKAQQLLSVLEQKGQNNNHKLSKKIVVPGLPRISVQELKIISELANLDINQLTPLSALNTLAEFKEKLQSDN